MTSTLSNTSFGLLTRTVLVCDHQPMVRRSVAAQLAGNRSHLRVVGAVPDGLAAVEAFAATPTDVVLVGVHRGTTSGTAAVQMLARAYPSAPIVVFGSATDTALLLSALGQGAVGLMLWDVASPLPRQGLATPGTPPVCDPSRASLFTDFELALLGRIGQGQTNPEIARKMYVSVDSVKTRCRGLFRKLGARDRAHAVALGLRHGLLQ